MAEMRLKIISLFLLLTLTVKGQYITPQSDPYVRVMGDRYVRGVGALPSTLINENLIFHTQSRSELSLVDSYTNNATILPVTAQFNTSGEVYLALSSTITFTSGEIIIHAYQPVTSSTGGLLYGGGGTDFIQLRTNTQIGVRFSSTLKLFTVNNLSQTSINVIRVVATASGTTKIRVYCNDVESSSGEQDCAALKNFVIPAIGRGSNILQQISYINIVNSGSTVLTMHPTGRGLYEYDESGSHNNATWSATPTSIYRSDGTTYLMDNGYSIYEKPGKINEYVPYGGYTETLTGTLEYQLKETFPGSLTKHNLAPSLIQFNGDVWDRSNATIWKDAARLGFYDATSATTKKRWHSSELNQTIFKSWLQDDYKDIVFAKILYDNDGNGRYLEEIMAYSSVLVGADLAQNLRYAGYKKGVSDLAATFTVSTTSADLTWTDVLEGSGTYQIWRSVDGREKTLVGTTAAGASSYSDATCKQGAFISYYIRPSGGSLCHSSVFQSPLCWRTDQSTLTAVVINNLTVNTGGTVTVNWGDGTTANYTVGVNDNITKNYSSTGQYNISLSGDVRRITVLGHFLQVKSYGDLTNWVLPKDLTVWHWHGDVSTGCNFTGNISDHINYIPSGLVTYHVGYNAAITGDISGWRLGNTTIRDMHIENCSVTGDLTNWTFPAAVTGGSTHYVFTNTALTGNVTNWRLPDGLIWLNLTGSHFSGDFTNFYFPATLLSVQANIESIHTNTFTGNATNWTFPSTENIATPFAFNFSYCGLTGDMSGVLIPVFTKATSIIFEHNAITKPPRGSFKWITDYDFQYNSISTDEVDGILAYIDAYFTGGVVPLANAAYYLNGTGNGVPSATGLAAKSSIEAKYTAAGFTATITVNQ